MPVQFTQDEMNILNLNGITQDEIRANVEYLRATGLNDQDIRNQYTSTLNELRPITKQSYNDVGKIKEWQEKGGITPFEYANKKAIEYYGNYSNIDNSVNYSPLEEKIRNYAEKNPRNKAVDERIENNKRKIQERNERVNNGTGSFFDRASAALDRIGQDSLKAQIENPVMDPRAIPYLKSQEVDKSKKIDFAESLQNSMISGEWIPFIGGYIKGQGDKKIREIQEHILKGEPIRQDELKALNNWMEARQEETVRGYTFGGSVAKDFLPSLVRFGAEIAAGSWVLKGLGLVSEAPAAASIGTKAANAIGNMAKYGIAGTALPTGWNDTYQNLQERLLNNGFEFSDKGALIFKESTEKPAISFLKSLGQTFAMFSSEASGELLNIPMQGVMSATTKAATPISKYIMSQPKIAKFVNKVLPELSKQYEKINKLKPKGAAYDFLKNTVKFDGLLEEMGEEAVEDVLNLTLGTGDEKRTVENYAKAVFKSPDEWAIIAGAVILQGGTLSAASHLLGSYMEKNGASDDEILEVMKNLSEIEKETKINELIEQGEINVSNYKNKDLDDRNNLKNKYFTQLKNIGKDDVEANETASIFSEIIANSARDWGISLDDAEKKFAITLENMSDSEAIEQWKKDNQEALQGRITFNAQQIISNKLNEVYNEFDNLPSDFNDQEKINKYIDEMQVLGSLSEGSLDSEYQEKAQELISEYEQSNPELANAIKDVLQTKSIIHNQTIDKTNIEKSFGDSVENITENVKADLLNILQENDIDESEFNFEDIRIYGSYSKGKNKDTSDLDLIVQYSGSMREDDAFNMFADSDLSIEDVNGRTVKIDINPINRATSGTIDESLQYFDELEKPKFQSIYMQSNNARLSSEDKANVRNYKAFVLKVLNNQLSKKEKSRPLNIGKTPAKLVSAGISNNDMTIGYKVIEKAQDNRNKDHNLSKETISNVLEALHNPIVVIKAPQNKNETKENNRFSVIVDLKNNNNYIVVAIDSDKTNGNTRINDIRSIHSRDDFTPLIKNAIDDNRLLKVSRSKIKDLLTPKIQSDIISDGAVDLIKRIEQKNREVNNTIYFQRKIRESEGQLKLFQDAMQLSLFQQENIFKSENTTGENVETEIKENYTQKDVEAKQSETSEISDVGDSLLGNLKKNKKQYTWDELAKMNDLLRQKYLSKSYVYQMPSIEEFKKQGFSNKRIAFVQNVYSKINSKPAKGYEKIEDQKLYFDFVQEIMNKTIEFAKENANLIDNHTIGTDNSLFKILFPDTENKKPYSIFRAYPEYNKKAIIAGGNKLIGALYLDYSTEKNIKKLVEKLENTDIPKTENKETVTGWKKYFDVDKSYRGWFVADRKSGMIISSKELPSKEIAEQLAEKMYEHIQNNIRNIEIDFGNLRNYIPRRKDNQNVNPEALIEVFGFRGINFGNWTKQSERQDFVNLAYDSLYDLSELLNLPPKELSLGGKLGLAFGAQGRSGAAGHFIPAYNEINLTRKSGAGSLAHEWWHALDYYFGDQSKGKDFTGQNALSLREQGFLRDEIYNAIQTINNQMKFAPLTAEELESKKDAYSERIKRNIEYIASDIKKSFAKSKNADSIIKFIDDIVNNSEKLNLKDGKKDELTKEFNNLLDERRRTFDNVNKVFQLLYQVERLQKVDEMAASSRKYTDYYTKAEKLNLIEKGHGKTYWTENTEMGARAFASYILDKMNQRTMQNNFLVRDEKDEYSYDLSIVSEIFNAKLQGIETEKNIKDSIVEWYPANPEERKRIFDAFDNLFKRVKTRNENENTILFQSAFHGTPHKFDSFSTENIGTGEGAQAHGWGLYFAGNKDVSEDYRRKLSGNKVFYDGQEIEQSYVYTNKWMQGKDVEQNKYLSNLRSVIDDIGEIQASKKISLEEAKQEFIKKYESKDKLLSFQKNYLEIAKNIDTSKIDIQKGQLFEVDIPEDEVLLDENKLYSEQSKTVQDALVRLYEENWENYQDNNAVSKLAEIIYTDNTSKKYENNLSYKEGRSIYNLISDMVGSDKNASELLNRYGIKGITYDGRQDGRCYVIFDDKAINVLKTYYQGQDRNDDLRQSIEDSKGFTYQRYNFDGTVKDNLITVLKNKADKSTIIHEFAHVYLTTLNNMARENERARDMLLTVNKWLRYNGIEYTTAQHEKFANGFVAYVRSGKAPTYGLKRAFENFRKWLGDIYNSLLNSDEVTLDDETKKVFDEILGNQSLDKQKELTTELLERAKANASLRLNEAFTDEKNIKPGTLTDKQMRFRDTAYSIIWTALSNSKNPDVKNFIKDKKQLQLLLGNTQNKSKSIINQREKLEFILSELEDELSANDGFLPEWSEFFSDPGLEDGGHDAELALDAFDVLVDKKYLYADMSDFGFSDEDYNRLQYELDYIIDEYKNSKGEERSIPMSAFYEWVETTPDFVQEDLIKKWESTTNEIERYESLSKFEQAKEDLKIYAATMKGQGDYSQQFAEFARKILKRLDFMTELDKARIFDKLKDFNSFREIEQNLDDVMDYAQTIAAASERKQLADDIDREVRMTIHEWRNGIKRTKYTYPANKLFERLRQINKYNQDEVQYLYDSMVNEEHEINYEADAVNSEDYYKTIEKMFITFKANGSYYNSTEFLKDLLDKIQSAKFSAKLARDEIDFERRMQQINVIDECARALDEHKGKVSKLEQLYRHGFNLNSALEMMFNKGIKNKFTLDYLYAQRDAKVGADRNEVLEKLAGVYGFKGKFRDIQLFNKFIDMTKKEFEIKQRYTPDKVNGTYRITHTDKESGRTFTDRIVNLVKRDAVQYKEWEDEPVKLSRMELLYYYIQAKNPTSYAMLTDMGDENTPPKGQFDKFEFDELLKNLTDQEKLIGDILQMAAEKYYPELNKYHIKKYHVDLGKVNCYFPRKSETADVKMLEMFNTYSQLNTSQKFQKQRTAGPGIRIAPANPLAVLFDHIEKSNTLIIMGEQLDLMNAVFKDSDLKNKIKNIWGDETANEFLQQVTSNLYSGQVSTISEAEKDIGAIMNNVVKSQIFLKPQVGLKQLISFMNYGVGDDYVKPSEWMKKFAAQAFTPKEWKKNIDYMMNIPYLKDRFSRGGSTDALKRQLEQRLFAKINLLDNILSANVRYGDIGAIILGGKPYIDCLLDKGYTEEQAIRIFIEKTVNDQQSSIPSTLSNIQRNAAHQPIAKMFFAYQNTPWQYFRTASNAIIRFKQNPNKETGLNMAKLVSTYLFVFPLLFNLASSLSPLILVTGGDDDDLKSDFWKSLIGGITFVPLAGMFINSIAAGFRGERASTGNWFDTAASKLGGVSRHISKGEVTALDLFQAVSLFSEAATGIPVTTAGTQISGMWDMLTGNIAKGALKVGGYTDYRARKVTGQDE